MSIFNQEGQTVHGDQHNVGGDMTINQGDTYSGDFRGAILNVRSTLSNVTQTVGAIPCASEEDKQTLGKLLQQLSAALEKVVQDHPDSAEEAEAVAETTKALVEQATQSQPAQSHRGRTGQGSREFSQIDTPRAGNQPADCSLCAWDGCVVTMEVNYGRI